MEFLVIAFVVFWIIYVWIKTDSNKYSVEVEKNSLLKIQNMIDSHAETLGVKYRQKVYQDDYGNFIFDDWTREVRYFIDNVIFSDQTASRYLGGGGDINLSQTRYLKVSDMIFETAISHADKFDTNSEHSFDDIQSMPGNEFQILCADLLKKNLWSVRVVGGSNDQGIDIYGELNGVTAVFQCKRYDTPVGNAAVQEIISGRIFANTDLAVVITNSSFTRSAKKLANTANVILIHYSEIEYFSLSLLSVQES